MSELELQPKAFAAEIAESYGLNVPRRLGDVESAEDLIRAFDYVRDGNSIILRSEHPSERGSDRGIAESFVITPEMLEAPEKFNPFLLGTLLHGRVDSEDKPHVLSPASTGAFATAQKNLSDYLKAFAINPAEYGEEFTYSIWEYIPGVNVTVIADDVLPDRYHIITQDSRTGGLTDHYSGALVDGAGSIMTAAQFGNPSVDEANRYEISTDFPYSPQFVKVAISYYEQAQRITDFGLPADNCPILEMQITDSLVPYFLQLNQGRQRASLPEQFKSDDFPQEEGWVVSTSARGSTGGDIWTRSISVGYDEGFLHHPKLHASFWEGGSIRKIYQPLIREILSHRRDVFIGNTEIPFLYAHAASDAHVGRSEWFAPAVALSLNRPERRYLAGEDNQYHDWLNARNASQQENDMDWDEAIDGYSIHARTMQIATDGRTAYVRPDPDSNEFHEIDPTQNPPSF